MFKPRRNNRITINKLRSWANTYAEETDDEGNPDFTAFKSINKLADKLESNSYYEDDIKQIEFHLLQMKGQTTNIC